LRCALLRKAGDFKNNFVVEYATIEIIIPNVFLPKNLQCLSWDCEDDTLIKLSVSPTGRLTNKNLYLESLELTEKFVIYLRKLFLTRSYADKYKINLIVSTTTKVKTTTKKKDQHSQKVKELLGIV